MNSHLLALLQSPLVQIALGSTAILALALFFAVTGIKGSAAERHRGLLCAFAALAFLPGAIFWAPKQPIPVKVAVVKSTAAGTAPAQSSDSTPAQPTQVDPAPTRSLPVPSVPVLLGALWAVGALLRLGHLGLGLASLRRLRRTARPFATHDGLAVLLSEKIRVPLLAGSLHPAILLPAAAASWPAERRAAVLAHEAGHRRRGDHLVQPLIGLLQALYWWQPLLWIAATRLRREREQACDDAVLASGSFLPSDYAETLLAVARGANAAPGSPAVAMASSGSVEERIRAILAPGLRRTPAGWVVTTGGLFGYLYLVFVLATSHLVAQTPKIDPNAPSIWIESQVVEIDQQTYDAHREAVLAAVEKGDAASILGLKGANSLDAPRVRTRSGVKAKIEITRTVFYPTRMSVTEALRDSEGKPLKVTQKGPYYGGPLGMVPPVPEEFDKKDVGVSVEVTPAFEKIEGGFIALQGLFRVVDFLGWTPSNAVHLPYTPHPPTLPTFSETQSSFYQIVHDGGRVGFLIPGHRIDAQSQKPMAVFLFLSARVDGTQLSANP